MIHAFFCVVAVQWNEISSAIYVCICLRRRWKHDFCAPRRLERPETSFSKVGVSADTCVNIQIWISRSRDWTWYFESWLRIFLISNSIFRQNILRNMNNICINCNILSLKLYYIFYRLNFTHAQYGKYFSRVIPHYLDSIRLQHFFPHEK